MTAGYQLNSLKPDLLIGGLFFVGLLAGVGLSTYVAPNSPVAMFIGFLVWPLSFGIGMSFWYGLTGSHLAGRLVRALVKSLRTLDLNGTLREELAGMDWKVTQTARVFVPIIVFLSFVAGLVIACVPTARNFELVVCSFTGFGLVYAMFVTWLARLGVLPLPRAC